MPFNVACSSCQTHAKNLSLYGLRLTDPFCKSYYLHKSSIFSWQKFERLFATYFAISALVVQSLFSPQIITLISAENFMQNY